MAVQLVVEQLRGEFMSSGNRRAEKLIVIEIGDLILRRFGNGGIFQ